MSDELVGGLLKEADLRVLVVKTTSLSREARGLHGAAGTSAALLGQALSAAALLEGLQKESSRINLQVECDGPLRGLFVDADGHGNLRGYVKNLDVTVFGNENAYKWRPALGNSGFLSVLRDLGGGEFYRSAVALEAMQLDQDLERYFDISDQNPAAVALEVLSSPTEPLGSVAGLLLQPLPNADRKIFDELKQKLRDEKALRTVLERDPEQTATALLKGLFDRADLDLMSRYPLAYKCPCSLERVQRALLAMGKAELQSLHDEQGRAEAKCEFCGRQYVVEKPELAKLLSGDA